MGRRAALCCAALLASCSSASHPPEGDGDGDVDADTDGDADGQVCLLSCAHDPGSCSCPSEPDECDADDDCALARNAATCCGRPDCGPSAYANSVIDAEPCLLRLDEEAPAECALDCSGVDCWAEADCSPVIRAYCNAGACDGSYDCAPDTVLGPLGQCVPECAVAADCVLARRLNDCCPACEAVSVTEDAGDPCLVDPAQQEPDDGVEPALCTPVCDETCPFEGCPEDARADCVDQKCVVVEP